MNFKWKPRNVNVWLLFCIYFLIPEIYGKRSSENTVEKWKGTRKLLRLQLQNIVSSEKSAASRSYRKGRYLLPFAFVNFPPEPCSPINTQSMDGVCLSRKRCSASNGIGVGSCQNGLGTCCKFTKQCFSDKRIITITETVENLMSSSFAGSCEFSFPKQQGICQIRLDFVSVTLQDPYTSGPNAGNCQSESITVMGASNLNGPLKVCGRLTGQHMILSYGATSDWISVIAHSEMQLATYNIRATQIPCVSTLKAPDDCLQYFTATTSAIKSFGFPKQLNNQNYMICVNSASGGNTLSWMKCTDTDSDGVALTDRFKVSDLAKPCLMDWIGINSEKRCGKDFIPFDTMRSQARVWVNFDENEQGDDIFRVKVPLTAQQNDPSMYCRTVVIVSSVVFDTPPTDLYLCAYNMTTNVCDCQFSNIPNKLAQAFAIEIPSNEAGYLCPKIKGYMASPEMTDQNGQPCRYYAKIRTTDRDNTGFCLRYQTM